MYKIIKLFLLLSITLVAYTDMDMDGVDDKNDQCPNTSLTELVDLTGCTIKELKSPHHFDITVGYNYSKETNTTISTSSIQADYFYKNLSIQLSSSFYNSDIYNITDSGQNDTYLNGYYQLRPSNRFLLRVGGGVAFPTYNNSNNKIDYSLALYGTYSYKKLSILGSMGYTLIGDRDDNLTSYYNTQFYNIGLGYYLTNSIYSSISYNSISSIYNSSENINSISFYNYYNIDNHWFLNLNYTYGLSDLAIKNSIGVKVGYYW
jgi:hypothetical protein